MAGRLFLCLVLASGSLLAQSRSSSQNIETVQQSVAQSWETLQVSLKAVSITPEERIRQVDAWQVGQQENIEAIQDARREVAPVTVPIVQSPAADMDVDVATAAAIQSKTQIAATFEPVRTAKLAPEERVQEVDAWLIRNHDAVISSNQAIVEAIKQTGTAQVPVTPSTASDDTEISSSVRAGQKIREIVDDANSLSPEDRIARIDANQASLAQKHQEMMQLLPEASAAALSKKQPDTP